MTYDLIFRNTLYGDVAVAGEQIAAVGEISENAPQEIDAEGKWLLPGGVDAHTHLNLTVGENSTCDGWEKGSAAALAGGTTTVIEHISFDPAGSCRAALRQAFIESSGRSCCDYGLHAVAQKVDEELLRTLPAAVDAGLPSWKVYTTYADPIFGEKLEELLRAAKEAGAVVCVHCEDDGLLRAARSKLEIRDRLSPEYHAASRPAYCEARSVREVLAAARRAGDAAVHIVHLSTAAGLHEIRHAREQGQTNITVETCPQYLLLDESLYRRGHGSGPARRHEPAPAHPRRRGGPVAGAGPGRYRHDNHRPLRLFFEPEGAGLERFPPHAQRRARRGGAAHSHPVRGREPGPHHLGAGRGPAFRQSRPPLRLNAQGPYRPGL